MSVCPCLFAKDDETFSYNHHINRLSTIAEHYMIRRAIDQGVSKERLARAFNVNLSSINRRINLLEGICPEAITIRMNFSLKSRMIKMWWRKESRHIRNQRRRQEFSDRHLRRASNQLIKSLRQALR